MMFMFPFALAIIAGIVIFVIWVARRPYQAQTQRFQQRSESNALAILKERYAKGEITKRDFESIKKDIN